MCIKDKTTIEERKARSQIKDQKFRKMIKGIGYRNSGELFLKSLQNACIGQMKRKEFLFYKIQ